MQHHKNKNKNKNTVYVTEKAALALSPSVRSGLKSCFRAGKWVEKGARRKDSKCGQCAEADPPPRSVISPLPLEEALLLLASLWVVSCEL